MPKRGDIILFDWNLSSVSDHVGIVENVVDNVVTTIEGNSSKEVKRNFYTLGYSGIRAYCVPKYKDEDIKEDIKKPYYENGSTIEPVYADTKLTLKVGYLNPHEKCEFLGRFEGRAIVRYQIDNEINYKIGFVEYLGRYKK